jgi:hypothetical protein
VLPAASSYPALTLTVNVSASAPAGVTNVATIAGGGETNTANDTASDPTTIGTGGGSAAITLVQHVGKDAGATTSSTLAFASTNTAGNWLAVAIRAGRPGQVFTVTDTRGNTYRRALQYDETLDAVTLGLYYAENIASGPNTVTVTDTLTGGTLRFAIFEYSGVATSNSLDGTVVISEGLSGSVSSGSVTTTANGDLILGVMSTADEATYTAGSGFTLQERVPAAPGAKLAVLDRLQATAGPIAATATISGGQRAGIELTEAGPDKTPAHEATTLSILLSHGDGPDPVPRFRADRADKDRSRVFRAACARDVPGETARRGVAEVGRYRRPSDRRNGADHGDHAPRGPPCAQ